MLEHFPHQKHSEILFMRLKSPCRLNCRLCISNLRPASCHLICGTPFARAVSSEVCMCGVVGTLICEVQWWKGAEKPLHPTASRVETPQSLWTARGKDLWTVSSIHMLEVLGLQRLKKNLFGILRSVRNRRGISWIGLNIHQRMDLHAHSTSVCYWQAPNHSWSCKEYSVHTHTICLGAHCRDTRITEKSC